MESDILNYAWLTAIAVSVVVGCVLEWYEVKEGFANSVAVGLAAPIILGIIILCGWVWLVVEGPGHVVRFIKARLR